MKCSNGNADATAVQGTKQITKITYFAVLFMVPHIEEKHLSRLISSEIPYNYYLCARAFLYIRRK